MKTKQLQAEQEARKELIENIFEKLGSRITDDEEDLLDRLASDLNDLDVFKQTESLTYGNEHREAFKKALEKVQETRYFRNTTISIQDSTQLRDSFDVLIKPSKIPFLADLFVFFGMEMEKQKK